MGEPILLGRVAELTGIPEATIKTRIIRGELEGVKVPKGKRLVWAMTQEAIAALLVGPTRDDYPALYAKWVEAQKSGYLTGKVIGTRGVEANEYGVDKYWEFLRGYSIKGEDIIRTSKNEVVGTEPDKDKRKQKLEALLRPCLKDISPENLRIALSNVAVDYENKNCHFTQREQMYKAVRSFYKLLVNEGIRSEAEALKLATYKPRRIFPARKTVMRSQKSVNDLLTFADTMHYKGRSTFDRIQTKTILCLFFYAGLRREEMANLKLRHIDLKHGVLQVVDGKGHKDRDVGIWPDLAKQLHVWLTDEDGRRKYARKGEQSLLVSYHGTGLAANSIYNRVKRLAKKKKLDITPHGMRRTCITLLVEKGMPLSMAKEIAGHSDIKTTQGYIMHDAKKAVNWMARGGIQGNRPKT